MGAVVLQSLAGAVRIFWLPKLAPFWFFSTVYIPAWRAVWESSAVSGRGYE